MTLKQAIGLLLILVLILGIGWSCDRRKKQQTDKTQATAISRDIVYAGYPKNISHICKDIKILENTGFVVGYCEELKNPVWVVYQLGPKSTDGGERPQRFSVDERTEAKVSHNDYTRTGYDRGHISPNHAIETRYGREAQLQTFLMSNICPQKPDLNRKIWRLLEQKIADGSAFRPCRDDYAENLEEIWIVTGPIFGTSIDKLPSGVAIPEAFFKLIIDEQGNTIRTRAYIIGQDVTGDEPANQFLTTVDEIERRTGLDLMWELDDDVEGQVEKTKVGEDW